MCFLRTGRMFAPFFNKSTSITKNNPIRHFSARLSVRNNTIFPRFTNAVFASAAAIGLSFFIIKKRNAVNEAAEVISNKELNFPVENRDYSEAISKCRDLLQRVKDEYGAPGIVIGVSINDKIIWTEGLGYSDVENRILCSAETVLRIASISKSITMTAVAKLWEQGKLDMDKSIQDYVPYFPLKDFGGKPVTITCRQLVSHLGGIRHYTKAGNASAKKVEAVDEKSKKTDEFESKEYYIKEHYKDVKSSLDLFKDDPLIANPGSKFYYSTHGWTLISAIVEAVSAESFTSHMTKLFKAFGMSNTFLEDNDTLIYHRARNYSKDKNGRLVNAPYVDNSYKWAGGGFLSTVGDLLKFGNAMLYSFQYNPSILSAHEKKKLSITTEQNSKNVNQNAINKQSDGGNNATDKQIQPGYLKSATVSSLWTPVTDAPKDEKYGMGWAITPNVKECQFCESKSFVYHTGGAVGASSVLMILPHSNKQPTNKQSFAPKGIIVAIITNLQSVSLQKTALKIAQIFDNETKPSYLR